MGFLKSLGLVEEIPEEVDEQESYEVGESYDSDEPEAELDDVNVGSLIDDIYAQNDLSDKSASIFRVEDMINSLPKEMATDVKKQSVISILNNFGLTVTSVSLDGEKRLGVLSDISNKIKTDAGTEISEWEYEIEQHKIAIQELEKRVADKKEETKTSEELISVESERIAALIKFVGEEVK